jgi:hypothetical protein
MFFYFTILLYFTITQQLFLIGLLIVLAIAFLNDINDMS